MGFISIPADTDGDLHNAAMHNSKFNAIVDVLNGNIDHENLEFPESVYTLNFSAGTHVDGGSFQVDGYTSVNFANGALSAVSLDPTYHTAAAAGTNVVRNSWLTVPPNTVVSIVDVSLVVALEASYTAGQDCAITGQVCTAVNPFIAASGYTTLWSATSDFFAAGNAGDPNRFAKLAITTGASTLNAGNTFRIVVTNATPAFAAAKPPLINVSMTVKSRHVA
jgi:hypothetical protein